MKPTQKHDLHIYAIRLNGRVSFALAGSEAEATTTLQGGKVIGIIEAAEFLAKEKQYRDYFKELAGRFPQ